MNNLFIDCKYGVSGDMMLSSLVDLGADLDFIIKELKKLPIDSFEMHMERENKDGISCNHLNLAFLEEKSDIGDTHTTEKHLHHRHHDAQQIFAMIENSKLPKKVKARSLSLFKEVARAEGKVHGIEPLHVHFHEVGAMDSIIDIIGVCLAIESLNIDDIIFSRVPTGHGMIKISHGLYPVPAPATAEILIGVPLSDFTYQAELTTPTGAAFSKILADEYNDFPTGEIVKIGYGCGSQTFPHPNILRSMILKKKEKKNELA